MVLDCIETYKKFIDRVIAGKWENAVYFCQLSWVAGEKKPADKLKSLFEGLGISECIYIKKSDMKKDKLINKDVVQDVIALLVIQPLDKVGKKKQKYKIRLVKESGVREPSIDGTWGVNPVSALREEKL